MNEKQLKDAERLYQSWSPAQLVRATTIERQDYEPEALDLLARELSRRGVPQADRDAVEQGVLQQVQVEKKRLTGIRGLLLLFVIGMVAGSLFHALLGVALLGAGGLFTLCGAMSLVLAGYGIYAFYFMVRKRSNAPQHAQRFLFLGFLLGILETLAAWKVTHHFDPGALGVGGVGTSVWLGYLSWSRRVAHTYGQPQHGAESRNQRSTDAA